MMGHAWKIVVRSGFILALLVCGWPSMPAYAEDGPTVLNQVVPEPNETEVLQFTSGGHVLGFSADGVYLTNGDFLLRESFVGAARAPVSPKSAASMDDQLPALETVRYADLWPGIDLTYDSPTGGILRSTYTVAPGADPGRIRLRYNAAVSLAETGSLSFTFETGSLNASAPIAWQEIDGVRVPVEVSFHLEQPGDLNEVSFQVGDYDPDYPLTIDPTLAWNTFLGGSYVDIGTGIAVDASGNIYVTGYSNLTWGSPLDAYKGNYDAFVAKLDSSGLRLWHTFLGSTNNDNGYDLVVDGIGNIFVTGASRGTWGSPVNAYSAYTDAFIAKLDNNGALLWNTFLGGSDFDYSYEIAVDGSGSLYVTGTSQATWGSPVNAFSGSVINGFAAKLNSSGVLVWNTFLNDRAYALALDTSGNILLAGDIGVTLPRINDQAYVAELNNSGVMQWQTIFGSTDLEAGSYGYSDVSYAIAVDGSGNVYVAGVSNDSWGSPINSFSGNSDAFIAKFNGSGSLQWNTFLGGSSHDYGEGITLDENGNVYVTGTSTASWGDPIDDFLYSSSAFAAQLDSDGALVWNTFMGIDVSAADLVSPEVYRIPVVMDGSGNVYVAGSDPGTWGSPINGHSPDFYDAFVAKITLPDLEVQGDGVTISADDTTPASVDLTDFGSAAVVGEQITHTFDLLNKGTIPLTLTGSPRVTISGTHGADFTLLNNPYSPVGVENQTDFVIQFDPSGIGLRQATVSITNICDDKDPYTFAIQGTGAAVPEIDVQGKSVSIASGDATPSTTDGTDYGAVMLLSGASQTYTILDTGTLDMNLSGAPLVEVSGAAASDFSVSTQPVSPVAAGGSTTFTITFTPSALGLRRATLSIPNDDSDENPFTFAIQGIGYSAPTVITDPATLVETTSGTLNGSVDPNYDSATVSFEYGTSAAYGKTVAVSPSPMTASSDISADLTGLIPNTTYHFRAAAINTAGTSYGEDLTFTTLTTGPEAVTKAATAINAGGATFNGTVNAYSTSTVVTFEYGTDTAYGSTITAEQSPVNGAASTAVSAAVTGLSPNTTYHFRVVAVNASGTSYGNDMTVTINAIPEVDVLGLGQSISSGDTTPSTANGTDFGYVPTGSSVTQTFTIQNNGTLDLNLSGAPLVEISGAASGDFNVSAQPVSPVTAGESTTFTITFTPSVAGQRQASLSIANDDPNENPYTFALQGNSEDTPEIVYGGNTYPSPNAELSIGPTFLTLEFNMDVKGVADPQSANAPGNYLLFSDGGDGFQTVDCAGGVVSTDVNIPIGKAFYDDHDGAGPFLANVTVNDKAPLPAGNYRFLACGTTSIENLAGTELNDGADTVLDFSVAASSSDPEETTSADVAVLPTTGFTPGRMITLPEQTVSYTPSNLCLEIPGLDIKMDIVGVPQSPDGGWDVSWLGRDAGWLNGTAYPTWNGNSVLTGHVVDANGKDGPFRFLNNLMYGDQIIIHDGVAQYVYEVRTVTVVDSDNMEEMLRHEEKPWITLVTCRGYDETTGKYKYRVLVRAVLVKVK